MKELEILRGATNTLDFEIPCDASNVSKINVYFGQDDDYLFMKATTECELDGTKAKVKLTREETLKFTHRKLAQVQCFIETKAGETIGCKVADAKVLKAIYDGDLI